MSKVRWGIVSTGRITHAFARDCAFADNAEITAVASRKQETARSFADQYQIPTAHGGYDKLWSDPNVDAVYIATPHTMHRAQTEAALRAGKAVLCEKPFTVTPAECSELIDIAAETDVYCMEGMWTWFLPAIRKAKAWVDQGRIGAIRHIKADFGYPIPYAADRREYAADLAGGCLLEMGVYPVALSWFFLRQEPELHSVLSHLAPNGVEDDVVAQCSYGDVTVSIATSFRCKLQNHAYIIGEEGFIQIPDFWRADECALYKLDERIDHFKDQRQGEGFEYQIQSVSADILAGRKQSPVVTLADSLTFQDHMAQIKQQFGAHV